MKGSSKRVTKFLPVVVVCLLSIVIAVGAVAGIGATDNGAAVAQEEFVKSNEFTIAQITDMHYYSHALCYGGTETNNAYSEKVRTGLKLVVESRAINMAALENIRKAKPDALFCTGDMTMNGEFQSHIEVANLLRQLQNDIRAEGKPNFQIFVLMGNHDMYNGEAYDYRTGDAVLCDNVTRVDITKIYSSLGFPSMTDEELGAYYDSLGSNVYADRYPYRDDAVTGSSPVKGVKYVNSTLSTDYEYKWLYIENGQKAKLEDGTITDYDHGDLSSVVWRGDRTILNTDDECSVKETQHHLGGLLFDNVKEFFTQAKEDGLLDKDSGATDRRTVIAIAHHNVVPHFIGEDSLLKDFTFYNTFETADEYADLGARYMFSGHMHANDITSRVSLNGNYITDIETASATGYKGSVRYNKFEQGTVSGAYAENFSTHLELVGKADITSGVEEGLLKGDYFDFNNLNKYIERENGKVIITDCSEYSVTKLFRNIIQNVVYSYISVDFINNAGDFVANMLPEDNDFLNGVKPLAKTLVNNIVRHVENVGLDGYVYSGDVEEFKGTAHGQKLCGYLDELVTRVLNMPVNDDNETLFDFGLGCYLDHVGGTDTTYADATVGTKQALDRFLDGSTVKKLVDILLDEDAGLMRIVKSLFKPIDLAYGMTAEDENLLTTTLGLVAGSKVTVNSHAVVLDDIVPGALNFAKAFGLEVDLDFKGLEASEFIDDVIDSYVTDSFYTSLGQIAYDILSSMTIDASADLDNNFEGYTTYKGNRDLAASYVEGKIDNTPTAERGMLPSMITVTFGEDPTEDKNISWVTDKRIYGTDIEYCEGTEFNISSAKTQTGTYTKMMTTTANIDLGIFATLMHVDMGKHCVELTGLEPDTVYSYRVGSSTLGYWSDVYTFKTAPEGDADFEILLISDIQGSAEKPYAQAKEIMANIESVFTNGYAFMVNCGDVVDNSRNLVQWKYYFNHLAATSANTTTVVAAGNHDKYTYEAPDYEDIKESIEYSWIDLDAVQDGYNYLFNYYNVNHAEQDASAGMYYSFDYSGVHFTVLNTNDLEDNGSLSKAQTQWLKNDLASTEKTYKVVIMHKGLYSSGSHITDTDVKALRKQLTSVFAENGVSLVLSGHDHTYSESYYLDANGEVVENELTGKAEVGTGKGVLYITLGTFGDKFYNYVESEDIPLEYGKDLHKPALNNPTFGKLVYKDGKLYYYGYQYDVKTGKITDVRDLGKISTQNTIIIAACAAAGTVALAVILAIIAKRRAK